MERRFGLLILAVLAYTFAGFGVYWLKTGSGTIGVGGSVTDLGGLVWFLPLMIGFPAIVVVADRGPFRALYEPRSTVTVGPEGLAWWTARGGDARLAWSDLGGVDRVKGRFATSESIFSLAGTEVVRLDGPFKVDGRRRSVSLPTIVLEMRPNRVRRRRPATSRTRLHRERGCVSRTRQGDRQRPGGD